MAASRRREIEEEHVNHDRWLITYADMITLLMVLFIVMFAISQVDQKRFNELKTGMAAGFGGKASPFEGSTSVMDNDAVKPIPDVNELPLTVDKSTSSAESKAVAQRQRQDNQQRYGEAKAEVQRLDKLRARLLAALRRHGLENDVQMAIENRGLRISLISQHIVFAPNLATLTPRGLQVIDTLSPVLREVPDKLEIDGHTNQVKVKPKYFPTDWELSAARATTVLRHLAEQNHIAGSRLTASAFGHEKPLIDPKIKDSQKINKRVDVVVLSPASEETRALFEQVAHDTPTSEEGR